jgi:formamidopyrimidine-DNA glycosylase
MPELPEVDAHAERLTTAYAGSELRRFEPLSFTALKTYDPPPDAAVGRALDEVTRRGKHLLLRFGDVTFVVHLMQGGRLKPDTGKSKRPRNGVARFVFAGTAPPLLLTEAGTEHKAGVWVVRGDPLAQPPLDDLGPEATDLDAEALGALLAAHPMRLHTFLRDQGILAGIGRRLANEVCHRARLSPFARAGRRGHRGRARAPRHGRVQGPARRRPRPHGRAVPRLRRRGPRRGVPRLHRPLLRHLPDRRQGARRQHDEQVPALSAVSWAAARHRRRHGLRPIRPMTSGGCGRPGRPARSPGARGFVAGLRPVHGRGSAERWLATADDQETALGCRGTPGRRQPVRR